MGIEVRSSGGVAEIVIDYPPVNAIPVQGWFDLAHAVTAAGDDPDLRVVVLAAEGRGFCAGVDIKEMQRTPGHEALVGANRGCFAAFAAVYDCAVPVIVAVQGFCLGGGVGLAGNADIVVAAQGATFGLPEVDRGALGAATHLARLVPSTRTAPRRQRHRQHPLQPTSTNRLTQQHPARRGHQRLTHRIQNNTNSRTTLHLRSAFRSATLRLQQSQESQAGRHFRALHAAIRTRHVKSRG